MNGIYHEVQIYCKFFIFDISVTLLLDIIYDSLVKNTGSGRLRKKLQVQGAQILRNEAYFVGTPQ